MRPKTKYPVNPSIMVFLRPILLQRYAPIRTPGIDSIPNNNCHSPVDRRVLPFLDTMLEMMVPENVPLGKVTKS